MQAADLRHDRLALRLPVQPESVGIGRRAAAQFAEETGFAPATLWRVRLSVSEALSNVVLHAYPELEDGEPPHLTLVAEADPRAVQFTISDDGEGMRARTDSPGMGLGLALIANSCDELALDGGDDGGTIVRMTFLR
jgi:serine/threonine-protein kinase RsbW